MKRWFRSLQAQLLLWAILPVTFVIIGLAFTGVYTHQREMRDFVVERDLTLARVTARMIEDWLAYGIIGMDGQGLEAWLPLVLHNTPAIIVVDGEGYALAHPDLSLINKALTDDPGIGRALEQREGTTIAPNAQGESMILTYAPVQSTDWTVVIQERVAGIAGPILRLSYLGPIASIIATVISLLILAFGWLTIVHPVQKLVQAADQVSWGNYEAIQSPVGGVEELRTLHHALEDMVERIRGYETGIRDYLGAVTHGQEAERARLAREIHDGPVQELIALGQRIEMTSRYLARNEKDKAIHILETMRTPQLTTVEELRRIVGDLRPIYLEELGFLPALEMLVRNNQKRTQAKIRLEHGEHVRRLSTDVELTAYRIAQEALNNAIQYAQAQEILIKVQCQPEGMYLSVQDDGIGFTLPSRPDALTHAGHFGLVGIRERANLLGGRLQIRTAPGKGTEILVTIPDCMAQSKSPTA